MKKIAVYMLLACLLPQIAQAQTKQTFRIENGKLVGGALPSAAQPQAAEQQPAAAQPAIALPPRQQMIFAAQEALIKLDYPAAEHIYSQIIASDGGDIEAYLQRAVTRREMRDISGAQADAKIAVELVNRALQRASEDPHLYYQRSLALRVLGQFDQARQDVLLAINLGGKASLRNDLQAIELERMIAQSQAAVENGEKVRAPFLR